MGDMERTTRIGSHFLGIHKLRAATPTRHHLHEISLCPVLWCAGMIMDQLCHLTRIAHAHICDSPLSSQGRAV